ncbi:MAG: hypothetical protein B6D61_12780 [Bacteroidetes bacterium 4484_249]|nr:MAG: hypothetical protein B6D61_12780 [Bacteroidetes bacterium 4484_249]
MGFEKIDISKFRRNSSFYGEIPLLLSVKSFDLEAIRKRYIKSRQNVSSRVGSVERRKITIGGIVKLTIKNSVLTEEEILTKIPEPRGIDSFNGRIAISSENKVFIISSTNINEISNPWFSYIHTVNFDRKSNDRILVSSSGYDAIFEYDLNTKSKTYEWFAWENGFSHGYDPQTGEKFYLTRKEKDYLKFKEQGNECIFIANPVKQVLPTAKRSAFINSVVYDLENHDNIIATFFHIGAVFNINKKSNKTTIKLDGLKSPHGGQKFKNAYLGTSTSGGMVVAGTLDQKVGYFFNSLPGKPKYIGDLEWLQNSIIVNDNIVTIDSNRNSFVIFNPEKNVFDIIPFNNNWAIQDLIVSNPKPSHLSLIKGLGT